MKRSREPARPYPRTARVEEVLRELLAEEIERLGDADDRLRLLTITGVDAAGDLRHATLYFDHLSPEAAEALEEERRRLQTAVARQVRWKHTPHLAFASDPAVETGMRIDAALRRIGERTAGTR